MGDVSSDEEAQPGDPPLRRREARVRRAAATRGFRLQKSRRRDPRSPDYGRYWLLSPDTGSVVTGDTNAGFGMTLEEVETVLMTGAEEHQTPLP